MKVLNEPKAVLLHAAIQRKQQQCTVEILYISKECCTVSGMVYVNDMWRMQLSVCRTSSIIQYMFLNSEFSDSVLLF